MNTDRSRSLYDRALSSLVGGVNSSVRAEPQPYPFFVRKGDGSHIVDVDGNKYVDYAMGYGPLLLGHELPEEVRAAVQQKVDEGPMYGAPTKIEVELAEFVADHVPSVESVRFVNSGTEATMSAVRLARGYTGRDRIVMMRGGYHGGHESFLAEGEPGTAEPSCPGVPDSFAEHVLPVDFNDADEAEGVFEEHGDEIAGVITEPLLGNHGIVLPVDGYLSKIRDLCDEHGALMVLDEVITGFRVGGLGCAQSKFGVEPDITTFAKIIGGGFPVGAIGGKSEIMEEFTPVGEVFQAGTFSGHPVTMAAGLETLRFAERNDVYDHVNSLGDELRRGINGIIEDEGLPYTVVGTDSMFKTVFTRDGSPEVADDCATGCAQNEGCPNYGACPKNGGDVDDAMTERWQRVFWHEMLDEGVFLTPNQFESQFVSYAHTEEDVEETLEAYKEAL